jgi:hypothetical protein
MLLTGGMMGDTTSRRPGARVYRKPTWFRWGLAVATAACAGGAVWASASGAAGPQWIPIVFLFVMFGVLIGIQAEFARRYRLTIDDQGFEIVEWRRPSRFELAQVRGFRRHLWNNRLTLLVELATPGKRPVPITVTSALDAAFDAWAAQVSELDGAPGAPGPRADAFARDRIAARWVNWLAIATGVAALASPRPNGVALALPYATPLIAMAIVRWGCGRFTLEGERAGPPSLSLAVLIPGLLAGLRAISDWIHLVNMADVILPAMACGVVMGALALLADPRLRRRWSSRIAVVAACSWIYAGAVVMANSRLDDSQPTSYRAEVLDRWVARGRGGGPTLDLGPWGPRAGRDTTHVPMDVYERARVGGSVRVLLRPGWLGMAWFAVE